MILLVGLGSIIRRYVAVRYDHLGARSLAEGNKEILKMANIRCANLNYCKTLLSIGGGIRRIFCEMLALCILIIYHVVFTHNKRHCLTSEPHNAQISSLITIH